MLPPASSIFLRAASENCVAATVTFTFSLPLPRTCEKKGEHTQDACAASAQANAIYYVPPRLAREALLPLPKYIPYKRTFTIDRGGRRTPSPSPEYSEGRPQAIAW